MNKKHAVTVYFNENNYMEIEEYFAKRPHLRKSQSIVSLLLGAIREGRSPTAIDELPKGQG